MMEKEGSAGVTILGRTQVVVGLLGVILFIGSIILYYLYDSGTFYDDLGYGTAISKSWMISFFPFIFVFIAGRGLLKLKYWAKWINIVLLGYAICYLSWTILSFGVPSESDISNYIFLLFVTWPLIVVLILSIVALCFLSRQTYQPPSAVVVNKIQQGLAVGLPATGILFLLAVFVGIPLFMRPFDISKPFEQIIVFLSNIYLFGFPTAYWFFLSMGTYGLGFWLFRKHLKRRLGVQWFILSEVLMSVSVCISVLLLLFYECKGPECF